MVVESGIDPGFSYNVGKAHLRALAPGPLEAPDGGEPQAENSERPGRASPPGDLLPVDVDRDEALAAFFGGFGLEPSGSRIWRDVQDEPLALDAGLFLTPASEPAPLRPELLRILPLVGRTLRDPDRIIWRWVEDRLARVYIASWSIADQVIDVAVEISAAGWWAGSSLETSGRFWSISDETVWRRAA